MPSKVLEIGSNDGFLLSILKEFGHEVLGVDASPYMSTLAIDLGIPTICGIFPSEETLVVSTSKYDLIIANNVLNHSNNPVEFVSAISNSLTDRGKFILEVPYWKETVTSLHFDQIYHEHISYFTVKSLVTLLGLANLSIINIELVEYHGGSLRVVTSKAQPNSTLIEKYILEETSEGLFSLDRYSQYQKEINSKKIQFMDKVETLLNEGKTIVGIGAAAKANTLLTYYGFSPEKMKFIAEASQHKIGKVTPVTMIPILPDKMLAGISDCVGILLAWNIGDHLKSKLLKINPEMEFLYL
jgi:SAM-dependent methyltransferase